MNMTEKELFIEGLKKRTQKEANEITRIMTKAKDTTYKNKKGSCNLCI